MYMSSINRNSQFESMGNDRIDLKTTNVKGEQVSVDSAGRGIRKYDTSKLPGIIKAVADFILKHTVAFETPKGEITNKNSARNFFNRNLPRAAAKLDKKAFEILLSESGGGLHTMLDKMTQKTIDHYKNQIKLTEEFDLNNLDTTIKDKKDDFKLPDTTFINSSMGMQLNRLEDLKELSKMPDDKLTPELKKVKEDAKTVLASAGEKFEEQYKIGEDKLKNSPVLKKKLGEIKKEFERMMLDKPIADYKGIIGKVERFKFDETEYKTVEQKESGTGPSRIEGFEADIPLLMGEKLSNQLNRLNDLKKLSQIPDEGLTQEMKDLKKEAADKLKSGLNAFADGIKNEEEKIRDRYDKKNGKYWGNFNEEVQKLNKKDPDYNTKMEMLVKDRDTLTGIADKAAEDSIKVLSEYKGKYESIMES